MSVYLVWAWGLPAMLAMGVVAWAVCTARRNAGLVDIFWSLFFISGVAVYVELGGERSPRVAIVAALVIAWAFRLAGHLALRNWNAPEDHRYREIRARNEPGFTWKSLYLVFGLQAVLAWIISAPLAAALCSLEPLGALGIAGTGLALFGMVFEAVADAQLARFKADPSSHKMVMDRGLWRFSRHPNYFGEFCTWWGFYLVAVDGAGAWTIFSPLLMSLLLLRVSGVTLLEKDIADRRPGYRDYVARTNEFFPGPRRGT